MQTKAERPTHHYHVLDGMRGVAALLVVGMHAHALLAPIAFPHAYLAVDLFFALSGLVIAHAYGHRLSAGLSVYHFMMMRYVRLYPLYLAGTLVGIAFFLATTHGGERAGLSPIDLIIAIGSAILMLPSPISINSSSWLMPFNVAAWSLVFELGANLVLALLWARLTRPVLTIVTALGAAVLVAQTIAHGTADVGADWQTAHLGIARTLLSFCVGLAIHRTNMRVPIRSRWTWLLPTCIIVIAAVPADVGPAFDLGCILILFPAMIFAGRMLEPIHIRSYALLGLISYALYTLHGPALPIVSTLIRKMGWPQSDAAPLAGVFLMLLLSLLAWIADLLFDRPIRRWLGKRLNTRYKSATLVA